MIRAVRDFNIRSAYWAERHPLLFALLFGAILMATCALVFHDLVQAFVFAAVFMLTRWGFSRGEWYRQRQARWFAEHPYPAKD